MSEYSDFQIYVLFPTEVQHKSLPFYEICLETKQRTYFHISFQIPINYWESILKGHKPLTGLCSTGRKQTPQNQRTGAQIQPSVSRLHDLEVAPLKNGSKNHSYTMELLLLGLN